jgi:hypothetical protein
MESARFRRKAASILIFVDFSVFNLLEWTNIDRLTEERIYPDYHFKYQQCYSNKKRIKGIDALKQVSGSSNDQGMIISFLLQEKLSIFENCPRLTRILNC